MINDETNYPSQEQKDEDIKNPFLQRHKRTAVTISLIAIVVSFIALFILMPGGVNYQKRSDFNIRQSIAESLGKSIDDLTEDDFLKVTKLNITGSTLINFKLLRKCVNLQELRLSSIHFPKTDIPKWTMVLEKLHINLSQKRLFTDLSSLEKLPNLRKLELGYVPIRDFDCIKGLENLRELGFAGENLPDLKPLKELRNLQELRFEGENLPDLELLKELRNLQKLYIVGSHLRLPTKQVEELKKAIPNIEINYR
jgi:Leucine-rich repeat (LRR) protein